MRHKIKNNFRYKLFNFMPYLYLCSALFLSCSNDNRITQPSCPACPEPTNCFPSSQIQLSQLDSTSRERLKAEVLAEIKEETRLAWVQEFEKAQADKLASAKPVEPKPVVVKEPPKVPKPDIQPRPLPPTQKIERDAGGMKILRHTFATQIVKRLPIDERDVFTISDASVFCYVEISASEKEDREITIRFTHSTGLAQSYSLPISQSPAWRTWSKLNLTKSMTGSWLCEIFNEDNILLASRSFIVID